MFIRSFKHRSLLSAIACGLLVVSACDNGSRGTGVTDPQAGRENAEAMAREHANDTADASPASMQAPQRAIVSERLPYGEVADELVYGHFTFPADMIEPLPAIIVIHEWWGLNDNVRAMAERLAGEGYIVLAVDLYSGATAADPDSARKLMTSVVEDPAIAEENIRQAYTFLTATAGAPAVASLGWCFGGGWSLNAAMLLTEELDAAVIYYGQVTDDEDRLAPIEAHILGLFGAEDSGISVGSVQNFEAALQRLRKDYEIHIYPGAAHAFANPTGNNYNAEAAEDAWLRTVDFLAAKLTSESEGS
jgi:carboxymethylenebutenolidase